MSKFSEEEHKSMHAYNQSKYDDDSSCSSDDDQQKNSSESSSSSSDEDQTQNSSAKQNKSIPPKPNGKYKSNSSAKLRPNSNSKQTSKSSAKNRNVNLPKPVFASGNGNVNMNGNVKFPNELMKSASAPFTAPFVDYVAPTVEARRGKTQYETWDYTNEQIFKRIIRIGISAPDGENGILYAKGSTDPEHTDPSIFELTPDVVRKNLAPDMSDDMEGNWGGQNRDFDAHLVKIVGIKQCNQSGGGIRPLGLRVLGCNWFNKIGIPTNDETSLLAEMGQCCTPSMLYDCREQVLESKLYGAMGHCNADRLKEECIFPTVGAKFSDRVGVLLNGSLARVLSSKKHREEYGLSCDYKAPILDNYSYYPCDSVVKCIHRMSKKLEHLRNINLEGLKFEWLPANGSQWGELSDVWRTEGKTADTPFNASITLEIQMIPPRSQTHSLKAKKACVEDKFKSAWSDVFGFQI